jgi:hypothetical protein
MSDKESAVSSETGQAHTLDLSLRANMHGLYTLDLAVEFGSLRPTAALRRATRVSDTEVD